MRAVEVPRAPALLWGDPLTLKQFRMLAADHRANSILRTAPVAVFIGNGLALSVQVDDLDTPDQLIVQALTDAAVLTGRAP